MARRKGDKDITRQKRAVILAKKNVQETPVRQIAKEFGVSHSAVVRITPDSVPPDVLALSKSYEGQFIHYAQANAMKAQKVAFDKMHELNAKDATYVAEKGFNMSQIHNNRPTQIVGTVSDLEKAKALLKRMIELHNWSPEKAIAGIKERFPEVDEAKLLGD